MKYPHRITFPTLLALLLILMTGCDANGINNADSAEGTLAEGITAESQGNGKIDLRKGGVFSMSNAQDGNVVVAFSRDKDGTLTHVGDFPTNGTGSGGFEDTANSLILGSEKGETSPNNFNGSNKLLFATNAGSNSISVFRVEKDNLVLVETQDSGGEKPVSVTVNDRVLYVLNSGEFVDGLVPPNCTSGNLPSITGFNVSKDGELTPIPNSTRQLSGDAFSGCAQVSFNRKGDVLIVTERTARTDEQAADDEGLILTYTVNSDGTLGQKRIFDATGQGPFGFGLTKQDILITSEQFDGPAGPGLGAAAAYAINSDGTITPTSASVENGGTDTCWFVVNEKGDLGFATSFFGEGRISSYRIGRDGSLALLHAVASGPNATDDDVQLGASDISFSRKSDFLYQLNSFQGTINAFQVNSDGTLTLIQTVQAHEPSGMAARLGISAS